MMNKLFLVILVSVLVLGAALPAAAMDIDSITLRLNAGAGYTIIDLPTAFDWDPSYLEDWDYTDIKINVQCLFLDLGRFDVGAELGWTRLYYYHFRVPPVPYNNYDGSVGPVNLSVLGALELFRNFYVQAAAGPYVFGDGVTVGISASGMYTIPIRPNMAIPVAAFADVVFGDGIPISFGATVGFQYTLALGR